MFMINIYWYKLSVNLKLNLRRKVKVMKLSPLVTKSALAALAGIGLFININNVQAATVPAGLNLGEVQVEGLTAQEAAEKITAYADGIANKTVEIEVNGHKASTSARELGAEWKEVEMAKQAVNDYTAGNIVSRYMKQADLQQSPVNIECKIETDREKFDEFIDKNFDMFASKATNASLVREGSGFTIKDEVDGLKIDKDSTKLKVDEALRSSQDSSEIKLAADTEVDKAKVKRADLEQIKDVLGTYTTDFSSSSSERANNIRVGSNKLNGHLLMPGEVLSGYENMKPFTAENGYQIAHAYENGQVVDSVGGGACQIASTLYNAALRAEVGIKERKNHSMTVSYCPASTDAAIAGTYKDIKIANNRETPIYVESYTSGGKLTFTIWGKETRAANRKVEYVSEILSDTPAGVTYKDDPKLPAGSEVRESAGHNGRTSRLWKVVTVDGAQVEKTLVSTDTYMASNAIYKRGTGTAKAASSSANPSSSASSSVQSSAAASSGSASNNSGSTAASTQASKSSSASQSSKQSSKSSETSRESTKAQSSAAPTSNPSESFVEPGPGGPGPGSSGE